MFGGKFDGGAIDGRIEMMVPESEDMVKVAGEIMRLFSLSKMTARLETKTVSGMSESWGGVKTRS